VLSLRLIVQYTMRYKWRYLTGFFALLAASFLVMLPPVVLGRAIDALTEAVAGTKHLGGWSLAGYGALILGFALIEGFFRFGARLLVSGTSRRIEYEIRNELAARMMSLDQGFFLRANTGDLMARCTNDLQMVRDLLGPTLIDLGRVLTMLVFGFFFLLSVNAKLALISFAYFPVVAVIISSFGTIVERKYREVQDQFGVLSTHVQENVSGMRTVKAYAQEEAEIHSFGRKNREMMRRSMSWAYFTAALFPLMFVATGASTILVLWFGGKDVVAGDISLGEFVQFNAYLIILANPLMSLGWSVTALQQGTASMKRIGEVLAAEPEIKDPPAPVHLEHIRGDVAFRDVSFSYDGEPVLRNVTIEIPAGRTVALVGATGAGKTTLVDLLVRLHDPTQGSVTLDGVDVRKLSLAQLRGAVGFVPQETFLFSDPLSENVAYGVVEPKPEALDYAMATSQLSNDLVQLTHGLDTIIGERGVTLSGGQKQRTALARAVIKDPPVLILDDALSHVDTHTEEEILRRLREFMKDRTTILIAHRTSTITSADCIYVLDDGRVAEQGSHDELLAHDGLYARFYRRQLLVEQIEEDEGSPADALDPEVLG
jgi:ATP-binding cassette subfamily B protein